MARNSSSANNLKMNSYGFHEWRWLANVNLEPTIERGINVASSQEFIS